MHYDVITVRPTGPFRISVTFRDGLVGEVAFRDTHLVGVFTALKKPEFFLKVNCRHGFVEWPDDIDLAPDAMYNEIKKHGHWELT